MKCSPETRHATNRAPFLARIDRVVSDITQKSSLRRVIESMARSPWNTTPEDQQPQLPVAHAPIHSTLALLELHLACRQYRSYAYKCCITPYKPERCLSPSAACYASAIRSSICQRYREDEKWRNRIDAGKPYVRRMFELCRDPRNTRKIVRKHHEYYRQPAKSIDLGASLDFGHRFCLCSILPWQNDENPEK